jgi:putative PIN family toxin of toxin-antitoxin system
MSGARRKKIKRFVIDTNVWVSYCINGELLWLTKYVVQNRLLIYASPILLQEIKKVLQYAKVKKNCFLLHYHIILKSSMHWL